MPLIFVLISVGKFCFRTRFSAKILDAEPLQPQEASKVKGNNLRQPRTGAEKVVRDEMKYLFNMF